MRTCFKQILYGLSAITILVLLNSKPAFAQAHLVYGEVENSVGGTPTYANLSFNAYITTRPGNILTKTSPNCGYDGATGSWWIQCASFSSWSPGEVLHVDFEDAGTGETGFTEIVLDDEPGQNAGLVTLSGVPGVKITTTSLPDGQEGVAYSKYIDATDGTKPYSWSKVSGNLPPGLSLSTVSNRGLISGTPTSAGTYSFRIKVLDSGDPQTSDEKNFSITIHTVGLPLQITTFFLPDGHVGVAYSRIISAIGGTPYAPPNPYRWAIITGSLPPGLSLNSLTGEVSGTPTTVGTYNFTVEVTDAVFDTDTRGFSITIRQPILKIVTEFLPDGYIGIAYSETLAAIGGLLPYTWSIILGGLPPGLSLDPATGVISGVPDSIGQFSFKVEVTDSDSPQSTDEKTFSIRIKPQLVTICTVALPDGWVGIAYSETLCAVGGVPPYSWSIGLGSLPAGLTLNAATGVISGVPTAAGAKTFIVKVTDATPSGFDTKLLTIVINSGQPLTIITESLPDGQVGVFYNQTLAAIGGTLPYTWSITIGGLPPGLNINPITGAISGIPTTEGVFSFMAKVTDAKSHIDMKVLSITIRPVVEPPVITTESLPDGWVCLPYTGALTATGGATPYTWSIILGSLPPGLTLNSSAGFISGTPTEAGPFYFTVKVTDSSNPPKTDTKDLSITIHENNPNIITELLSDGWIGVAYSETLTAEDGVPPYIWKIVLCNLPTGLTLDSLTGEISGIPTVAGRYCFVLKLSDSCEPPNTDTLTLCITITSENLRITTESLPNGWTEATYSETLAASGGVPSYTWSIQAGNLPPGLALDANSGVISGIPTTVGKYDFTVKVTDSGAPSSWDTKELSITVGVDADPPTFSNTTQWSGEGHFRGPYPVHSIVTDTLSGVDSVLLYYRFGSGTWAAKTMTLVDSFYQAEIPEVTPDTDTEVDYYLKATDLAGNAATDPGSAPGTHYTYSYFVGIEEVTGSFPTVFMLMQNVPDPFVATTLIEYDLPMKSKVSLKIYNSGGQLVRTLSDTKKRAGRHKVTWDRKDAAGRIVSSGIYFYKLDACPVSGMVNFTSTKKMIVIE